VGLGSRAEHAWWPVGERLRRSASELALSLIRDGSSPPSMFRPQRVKLKDGRAALLRRPRPADAHALIATINAIGAEKVLIMTERLGMTVAQERRFLRSIDPRKVLYLVAEVGGRVVGSADFARGRFSKDAHTVHLGIAIRKEYRGLGIGKAMMEAGIGWARSLGVRKLTLAVFETNEAAIALYRQLGFAEEARLKGQVILRGQPVDEVLMARWL